MDYPTAYRLILQQGLATAADSEALINRLQQQLPPIPGQITSILLALKVIQEGVQQNPTLERELVAALHCLTQDSLKWFEEGRRQQFEWPPLLEADLQRIAMMIRVIFLDQ
ncbi:MAG: Dethiobiotin synthetase [Cyanobacteria bacterium P01_H01_bin.121]